MNIFYSCISVNNNWKYESGYHIGDFLEFKSEIHETDENNFILINNKKVARIIEVKFGIAGNHKMIIESIVTKERGVYTVL
jgi:hypothetical protein